MVAKTLSSGDHCADLEEIFMQLRKNNMHLNPLKCSFEVEAGKFLGFMITRRGIEENPDKCRAILEMRSPQYSKGGAEFGQEDHGLIPVYVQSRR